MKSLSYSVGNFFYYILCFCGLIWQVYQISENYFKFEAIKDISVLSPDESSVQKRVIYYCFKQSGIVDTHKYVDMIKRDKQLSKSLQRSDVYESNLKYFIVISRRIGVRFNINRDYVNIFRTNSKILAPSVDFDTEDEDDSLGFDLGYQNIGFNYEFMIGDKYCYSFNTTLNLVLKSAALVNVSSFEISIGTYGTPSDVRRFIAVDNNVSVKNIVMVTSYSIDMYKLAWPYDDRCMDYGTHRADVIADCQTRNGFVSQLKVIRDTDYELFNYTLSSD